MTYLTKRKYHNFRRKAKIRGWECNLSYEQFLYFRQGNCYYCGVEYELIVLYCEKLQLKTPFMTIDRVDNKKGYEIDNCVSCCFLCNRIKGNFFTGSEMKKIANEFIKPKLENFKEEVWEEYLENIKDGMWL